MSQFTEDHITDQKRAARGEQLRYAKTFLQARDEVHNGKWKVMILAGHSPSGEISAIRSLMPQADIVAVDKQSECVHVALLAGATRGICCDIADLEIGANSSRRPNPLLQQEITNHGLFDIVHLDLCSNANAETKALMSACRPLISGHGVLIVTFSYGRDVVPMFTDAWERLNARRYQHSEDAIAVLTRLKDKGAPELILQRISYVFAHISISHIRQVITYQGNVMPMCSVLIHNKSYYGKSRPVSFVKLNKDSYEELVTHLSLGVYDCTEERLAAIKRSIAARKAVRTRKQSDLFESATTTPRS